MKKLIITLSLIAFNSLLNAQTDLYFRIKKLINETYPELKTENKLIALNTWSIKDEASREANKGFEKTYTVYEHAKLKGGLKGIIVVTANKDNLSSTAVITLQKDGIVKLISVKAADLSGVSELPANVVFDASGATVYKNLEAAKVYESINKLITR